jgi:serine phosphatase RsbU (regulator of sigma subunit)
MEHAARRFARRVLLIHLVALLIIGILIFLAAREVYTAAREEALEQARKRQELLAKQTSRAIESYYRSILDNLDLQRRAEEVESDISPGGRAPPTSSSSSLRTQDSGLSTSRPIIIRLSQAPNIINPLLWDQLRGRASHFFTLDRRTMSTEHDFTDDPTTTADQIIKSADPWLKSLTSPAISPPIQFGPSYANLVAVPLRRTESRVLVAVVPLENVQKLFLDDVNSEKLMSAWLIDQSGQVMLSFDSRLIGMNLAETGDPQVRAAAQRHLERGEAGTDIIDHPLQLGPTTLASAMTTLYPVNLPKAQWWLAIASGLQDVDAVVQRMFKRSLSWAIFVILSVSAVLISTSFFTIRARLRIERVRRELLTHEIEQAREIQLAWLPDPCRKISTDLAAANVPASHISGDFYNWFELDDGRTVVLIGDVTGHGMAAAFLMATTQLLVRITMMNNGHPGECLTQVNQQLCSQGFHGQFVTMLLLVLDNQTIQFATAGHPAPLISDNGTFRQLPIDPQLVLGVEPDITYDFQSFTHADSTQLLLYTDGVTDVLSTDGHRLNLEGLLASLHGHYPDAHALIDSVIQSVDRFRQTRPIADDLTLVAIQLPAATTNAKTLTQAITI